MARRGCIPRSAPPREKRAGRPNPDHDPYPNPLSKSCLHRRECSGKVQVVVQCSALERTGSDSDVRRHPHFRGMAYSGFYIIRTGSLSQTTTDPENSLQGAASNCTDPQDFHSASQHLHLLERQLDAYIDDARYVPTEAPRGCALTLSWRRMLLLETESTTTKRLWRRGKTDHPVHR